MKENCTLIVPRSPFRRLPIPVWSPARVQHIFCTPWKPGKQIPFSYCSHHLITTSFWPGTQIGQKEVSDRLIQRYCICLGSKVPWPKHGCTRVRKNNRTTLITITTFKLPIHHVMLKILSSFWHIMWGLSNCWLADSLLLLYHYQSSESVLPLYALAVAVRLMIYHPGMASHTRFKIAV